MVWDIYPVVVSVSVVDAQGNDLLDPQTPDAFDVSEINAIYKEKIYECNKDATGLRSKAYMPYFYGLQSYRNDYYGLYILSFGEFNGAESYTNESVTIVWPDGSSDKISFNRDFKWGKIEPEVKQEWFLNNSKVSGGIIKIIK